jgi:hypothetical protein
MPPRAVDVVVAQGRPAPPSDNAVVAFVLGDRRTHASSSSWRRRRTLGHRAPVVTRRTARAAGRCDGAVVDRGLLALKEAVSLLQHHLHSEGDLSYSRFQILTHPAATAS